MGNIRVPLDFTEPLTGGTPNVRASLVLTEPLTGGNPNLRASFIIVEPLTGGNPNLRVPLIWVEALIPVPSELPVATYLFPDINTRSGIKWDRSKMPSYNNARREMTSGRRSVTPYMLYPRWNFEVSFEVMADTRYIANPNVKLSTVQQIVDLFKNTMAGSQLFLYQDPDDYHIVGGAIATGDGVTLQWPFYAPVMGTVLEPVGQIDLTQLAAFASTAVDPTSDELHIPGHGFVTGQYPPMFITSDTTLPTPLAVNTPYWPIVVDADHIKLATTFANAMGGTAIDITAAGAGDDTLTKGYAIYDNGTIVNPGSASLTLPNQIVFVSAPVGGHVITADFDYYFQCRFDDDKMELSEFAKQLYELQKLNFSSEVG